MVRSGDKTATDPDFQARVLARHAGDPHAIGEVGARVLVGRDAPQSVADGARLIGIAADQGDSLACSYASVLAASGTGRTQSWKDALDALDRAAALGDAHAVRQLGLLEAIGVRSAGDAHTWIAAARGREVHRVPRLVAYEGVLPPALCEHFIERARPKLVPARVNDVHGGGLKLDPMRTNTGAAFSVIETDLVMQLVRARIAAAAGVHANALEPLEVLHYDAGETYRPHVDFFHPKLPTFVGEMRSKGQRVKTCLVYLNDDFDDGETEFPKLGIRFRGSRGEALVFANVGPDGLGDLRTLHTGLPPARGEKWLLSQWIRSKPQRIA